MNSPVASLRLQDAWRECERNAIATEAAQSMVGALGAIEKRLRRDHPDLSLIGSVPLTGQ